MDLKMESNYKKVPLLNDFNKSNLYVDFGESKKTQGHQNQLQVSALNENPVEMAASSSSPKQPQLQSNVNRRSDLNKVFIGGINYSTTEETLQSYFAKYGHIVDCVVIRDPLTAKSKGFGFVQYADSVAVDELMKNRPHTIDSRELDIHRSGVVLLTCFDTHKSSVQKHTKTLTLI